MLTQQVEAKPVTTLLQGIDHETFKALIDHFHLKDYDALVSYAIKLGVKMLPRDDKLQEPGGKLH